MTDERELSVDGVSVRKWIDTENFRVPAVSFEIESDREEPVRIRLVDRIPESFPMDRVGFHPEHGSDNWTAYPDQRVGFERELDPGETVTTVYGVRIGEDTETDQFTGEPEVELHTDEDDQDREETEVLGDATISDIAPPERTDVVRDVIDDERETVPGLEGVGGGADAEGDPADDLLADIEEGAGTEDGVEAADAASEPADAEPVGTEQSTAGEPEGSEMAADTREPETGGATPGNVAAALADEIESGTVEEETLGRLREALGSEIPNTVDTRIAHLQSRVSDMEAYADAMEAFIDEKGTARELLEDMEAEVEELAERTERLDADIRQDVETRMDEARDHREALEDDIVALEEDLDDEVALLDEDVDSLEADLADLEDRLAETRADLDEEVESVEADLESLRDDVEDVQQWRDQLSDVLGG